VESIAGMHLAISGVMQSFVMERFWGNLLLNQISSLFELEACFNEFNDVDVALLGLL